MVIYDFSTKSFPWEYVLFGIICLLLLALVIFMLILTIISLQNRKELEASSIAFYVCGFLVASLVLFFASDYTFNQINSLRVMQNSIKSGNYRVIEGEIENCESLGTGGYFFSKTTTDYSFSVNGKWFYTDNGKRKGKCYFSPDQEKYLKTGTKIKIKYLYYESVSVLGGEDKGDYLDNGEYADEIAPNDSHNEILYLKILE